MLQELILYSGLAGITVFIGGLLANYFNHHLKESPLKYEVTHTLMSFGAGIVLSALALVLVPKGMEVLDALPMALSFLVGAITFMFIDSYLAKKGGLKSDLIGNDDGFCTIIYCLGGCICHRAKYGYAFSCVHRASEFTRSVQLF